MNKTLLSDEFKNRIPLNSGFLMGSSKNIIKISDLFFNKLKELNIPIKRHNIYNDSIISCPDLLPINKYIQQINSSHFIALHHHQFLNNYYISRSPKEFQSFLRKDF